MDDNFMFWFAIIMAIIPIIMGVYYFVTRPKKIKAKRGSTLPYHKQ